MKFPTKISANRNHISQAVKMVMWIGLLSLGANSQEGPRPDRWHGFKLDETTAAQAVESLGTPVTDKPERAAIAPIDKWFSPDLKRKTLRMLTFKEIEGFGRVDLYFLDDLLAVIQLQVKGDIRPTALPNIYGLEFRPYMRGFEEAMGVVERHEGKAYPKRFPSFYNLVAVSPTSVVNAHVSNNGWGTILNQSLGSGIDTAGGGFPGKVMGVQLVSRRLENKTGADLLK